MLCLNHGYPGVPIPVSFLTPGTSGSKVPSYPWVPVVTTHGFLTSRVTTCWVLVRTLDFPEVPLPAGKNPCLSLNHRYKIAVYYDLNTLAFWLDPERSNVPVLKG